MDAVPEIEIREADFGVDAEYRLLLANGGDSGACVVFTGLVRAGDGEHRITAMELEHYPGMTESSIAGIVATARQRWPQVAAVKVIHRVGRLVPGDQIVFVGVAGAHRGEAFAACEFIMDYLKTRAPLWKKEIGAAGPRWVESRDRDAAAAARWDSAAGGNKETG